MRFICISHQPDGADMTQLPQHLDAEVRAAWKNYASGTYREMLIRQDAPGVVLMVEAESPEAARNIVDTLPLSKAGLLAFDVIPLGPFTNWGMLFAAA